jgi:hypothetical protein
MSRVASDEVLHVQMASGRTLQTSVEMSKSLVEEVTDAL